MCIRDRYLKTASTHDLESFNGVASRVSRFCKAIVANLERMSKGRVEVCQNILRKGFLTELEYISVLVVYKTNQYLQLYAEKSASLSVTPAYTQEKIKEWVRDQEKKGLLVRGFYSGSLNAYEISERTRDYNAINRWTDLSNESVKTNLLPGDYIAYFTNESGVSSETKFTVYKNQSSSMYLNY